MPLFLYTKKQLCNFYIYNKDTMAWKLKKEWEGARITKFKKPLDEFTQLDIKQMITALRDRYFIEDKPKKKKKDVSI